MMNSDFEQPLGLTDRRASGHAQVPYHLIAAAALGSLAIAVFTFITVAGDPMGGEPYAVTAIHEEKPPEKPQTMAAVPADAPPSPPKRVMSAEAMEQQSGVTVVRGGASAPDALIIRVPPDLDVHLAVAPDRRLIEKSRFGPLPRIGADGSRASEIYARPLVSSTGLPSTAPRVALLIGGMGLDAAATGMAVLTLPGAVTLGFAPYGRDLEHQVANARDKGHEVVLQLPMEPYDYPQTNAGAHSLLTSASPAENQDHLHWLMSRFTGYSGVANFLGAKFTADEASLTPVLQEIAARGLYFADDGTSAQSLATLLAPKLGLEAAKADVVLNSSQRTGALASDLLQLEAKARDKGIAVGIASGLTSEDIERIARFAGMLEAKGIHLVPLSSLTGKEKGGSVVRREP
jgi:polysaccharide deacetylase 2 family uncharacterized protein YibQ